ncbi:hypothetical protein [Pannonibacter phragmitetus]|uniref:Uncharacterized protein n=1 Tax=Pannonibacter phragmitetus TaxID=121719 RepID=A0A0U2WDE8_9HYPH|nr:hypothetical protein [Pannonibacter phragmitetus]ALV30442.1 hypothetical protein APZ00_24695 [Pannonibacter phragmitetus]
MILTTSQMEILSKILEVNGLEYDNFMVCLQEGVLPIWKMDQLCEWINDEFMMHGLAVGESPNQYGVQLEQLLDVINRQRLKR